MAWAKNPIYLDNDGVTLLSAVIIYTDKSCDELLEMQIDGRDRIIGWYTTDNSLQLGMAENVITHNIESTASLYLKYDIII